jgi:hypothetical protein
MTMKRIGDLVEVSVRYCPFVVLVEFFCTLLCSLFLRGNCLYAGPLPFTGVGGRKKTRRESQRRARSVDSAADAKERSRQLQRARSDLRPFGAIVASFWTTLPAPTGSPPAALLPRASAGRAKRRCEQRERAKLRKQQKKAEEENARKRKEWDREEKRAREARLSMARAARHDARRAAERADGEPERWLDRERRLKAERAAMSEQQRQRRKNMNEHGRLNAGQKAQQRARRQALADRHRRFRQHVLVRHCVYCAHSAAVGFCFKMWKGEGQQVGG